MEIYFGVNKNAFKQSCICDDDQEPSLPCFSTLSLIPVFTFLIFVFSFGYFPVYIYSLNTHCLNFYLRRLHIVFFSNGSFTPLSSLASSPRITSPFLYYFSHCTLPFISCCIKSPYLTRTCILHVCPSLHFFPFYILHSVKHTFSFTLSRLLKALLFFKITLFCGLNH